MATLLYRGSRKTPRRLRPDGVWVLDRHHCSRPNAKAASVSVGEQVGCKCGQTWWTLRASERFGVYFDKGGQA